MARMAVRYVPLVIPACQSTRLPDTANNISLDKHSPVYSHAYFSSPSDPNQSKNSTQHSTHPIRIPDRSEHRLPRRVPLNPLHNNLSRTHPLLLHIQPMLHRPQAPPHNHRLRRRNQQSLRQSPRNIIPPHPPPNLIPALENVTRPNGLHPHTPRQAVLRCPAHRDDQRFPLAALCDPRARPHGGVGARGVVDPRQRRPLQGFHELVLDARRMIVENPASA